MEENNIQEELDEIIETVEPEEKSETTQPELNNIPWDKMIIGFVEKPIIRAIKDDDPKQQELKRQEFLMSYESQCLPILQAINFNDVLNRKIMNGKGLTDNQVLLVGFGAIAGTALLNILPYIKKKGEKNESKQVDGKSDKK